MGAPEPSLNLAVLERDFVTSNYGRNPMPDHRSLVRKPFVERSPLQRHRKLQHEHREHHPHAVLVSEGNDGVESNFAAVFGPMTAGEFDDATGRFFGGEPFAVVVESETAADIEGFLQRQGWTLDEEEVAMVLTPIPDPPPSPPDLHIEMVATDKSYRDFMRVVPGNRFWVPSLEAATDPDVGLLLGYVEGEPVVTSRLVRYREVAEITAVQVLETYRRRGYGRALTWAAIAEGRRRGCKTVILTATEMGYPLYLGMGFEEICAYRTYLPPRGERGR